MTLFDDRVFRRLYRRSVIKIKPNWSKPIWERRMPWRDDGKNAFHTLSITFHNVPMYLHNVSKRITVTFCEYLYEHWFDFCMWGFENWNKVLCWWSAFSSPIPLKIELNLYTTGNLQTYCTLGVLTIISVWVLNFW